MKTNEVFPSKYLKAEDDIFDHGNVIATIKNVSLETLTSREKGEEQKPVMAFNELPKGLILNKTNWNVCAKLFGADDSDEWIGNKVELTVVETEAFGDIVKAIRISTKRPTVGNDLRERFAKLYAEAEELKVEDYAAYMLEPNMTDAEIIALGKELKKKVAAAKQF